MIYSQNYRTKIQRKLNEYSTGLSAACWMGVCLPFGPGSLDDMIAKAQDLIGWATGFAALVAVGLFVYGGYNFILSGGDADKVARATNIITNTVIGLIIVFISRIILMFIIDRILG